MAKKRSSSSQRWLAEHFSDHYVKEADKRGFRSRAVFKLLEIDQKDHLFKPGMCVVDLGAAPGGWSQFAKSRVGEHGMVVALDILPMAPIPGVEFIQADFTEDEALRALLEKVGGRKVDVVLSDMAPNISGIKAVDQPKSMYLAELALDFAEQVLKPGGTFLIKIFQGEGVDEYIKMLRQRFTQVKVRKPPASRSRSQENYLLGKSFKL